MKIQSPFGPKIAIIKIPKKIVMKINNEVDNSNQEDIENDVNTVKMEVQVSPPVPMLSSNLS